MNFHIEAIMKEFMTAWSKAQGVNNRLRLHRRKID